MVESEQFLDRLAATVRLDGADVAMRGEQEYGSVPAAVMIGLASLRQVRRPVPVARR